MNNYVLVNESSAEIRAIARSALKGNWQKAILVTIVYFLLFQGVASILEYMFPVTLAENEYGAVKVSFANLLYTVFTSGAFTYGYIAFALSLFRKQEASIANLFDGFERIIKLTLLTLVMSFFIMLWSMLFLIPGIVAAYSYSQAYNILYDHPDYGIFKCISESKKMMYGNKGKLFVLTLSYFGWIILSALPTIALSFAIGSSALFEPSFAMVVVQICAVLFMAPVAAYVIMGEMVFYELAGGNLVKQVIEVPPLNNDPIVKIADDLKAQAPQAKADIPEEVHEETLQVNAETPEQVQEERHQVKVETPEQGQEETLQVKTETQEDVQEEAQQEQINPQEEQTENDNKGDGVSLDK